MKLSFFKRKVFFFIPLVLIFVLSGCTAKLAPEYDASLYKGITQANVKIMQLLASVTPEVKSSTFKNRQDSYNELIGLVDALVLQAKSRPMPENSFLEKVNIYLQKRGIDILDLGDMAPSATALEEVSRQLVKMKKIDMESGLKEFAIKGFKNNIVISMDQAITYEAFLER